MITLIRTLAAMPILGFAWLLLQMSIALQELSGLIGGHRT